jgi:EmrB/QacA subfamily drug resistance transporter
MRQHSSITGSSPEQRRVLAVLFIGVLMGALDIAIVGPALTSIRATFGVTERDVSWIFSLYVLFNLVGTPLMAKQSDRYGRRMVYVASVVLFAAGSLMTAAAPSFGIFLAGRSLQGFGAGGIFPTATAVIGDIFPPERRGGALGLIGAVFGIAFMLGPLFGGLLLPFGWQWLFLINLPAAALIIALALRHLPAVRRPERLPFDWLGMAALAGHLSLLAYGISRIDAAHFVPSLRSRAVWPSLAASALLGLSYIVIEQRARDPILRLRLYASRQTIIAGALAVGAGAGQLGVVYLPSLAVAAFGVSPATASFLQLPLVIAVSVGSPFAGRMLDRYGSRVVVVSGALVFLGGMLMQATTVSALPEFILAGVLTGLGLAALVGAPVRYIMLNEAPPSERAAAQGLMTLNISIGQLVSSALLGALVASRGGGVPGYRSAFLLVAAVGLVLAVMATGLKDRAAEQATLTAEARRRST